MRFVKDRDVKIINLWFTDILGVLKSFGITPTQLEEALEEGLGFDGSSVEGFARIYESDLVAMPDISTFQLLPWRKDGHVSARMFCDVLNPDRTPYAEDPRQVLKRNLRGVSTDGYTVYTGPEPEFFYFKSSENPEILDQAGYFDLIADDLGTSLRQKTIQVMQEMGIAVEVGHHEVAHSQHEIDLKYTGALEMADTVMTYRYLVKEIARQNGVYATFMPKPLVDQNGSGMHIHQSLFRNGENAFHDAGAEYNLSSIGRGFMAGLLHHCQEIVAVTNQWVNSYKRLVPGYEAPAYVAWGQRNRSALIRVPMYKPGKEKATRIEFRCPDSACNPYLAFSVMLAAGIAGIKNGYELPAAIEEDIFHMSPAEREEKGIKSLPGSLYAAIHAAENSQLVKESLGDQLFERFLANKRIEWDSYRVAVTDYELKKYLPIL
ncbi:MAG: type I glutamate--ammonia ligase [Candidatus Eisenbacteria bacterium]|uniref:Glutamine synthetase n=1 Tax=Eiseniibacteriota bacterium TaxID=2212470 RepID=A0A948RTQ0_UNCEI|nr:type I glutamate--ammonia ligase [Candidatus Eisenbacteria bacterium]MBU1948627.1 type I glutamate--ammonia ligase [Candidatus Eisenbacteria bacterium]MBU2689383.1 type I glutamate--ammonia ligase [Candidatus Eisenbacteria bacterium]